MGIFRAILVIDDQSGDGSSLSVCDAALLNTSQSMLAHALDSGKNGSV